jgi:chemotaxis signal transduction protein
MKTAHDSREGSYILVKVGGRLFGFQTAAIAEMVSLTEIHQVPDVPPHVRGVINLRGRVIPVLDLRMRLGMPSAAEDLNRLIAIFEAREEDHRKWVTELEAVISEGREFKLATDPHKCAFGRWYDAIKTDDVVLSTQLAKIDEPHQRIHRRGAEALALRAKGDTDGARRVAADIRTRELAGTLALFEDTKRALRESQREIIVVLRTALPMAAAVDAIESVEPLVDADISGSLTVLQQDDSACLTSIRKRARDGQLVLLLDTERLAA